MLYESFSAGRLEGYSKSYEDFNFFILNYWRGEKGNFLDRDI